jgi:hypothetical protein
MAMFADGGVEGDGGDATALMALLERKCGGSSERARALMHDVALELGMSHSLPSDPIAALALMRLGYDGEKVAGMLGWNEFEELCARLLLSAGYEVKRNIVLTRPRRQIDIVATSNLLSLCIDCKHYMKSIGYPSLSRFAQAQAVRTRFYKTKTGHKGPIMPVILTLIEDEVLMADGVPVVPMLKLRNFLCSINPYEGFALV